MEYKSNIDLFKQKESKRKELKVKKIKGLDGNVKEAVEKPIIFKVPGKDRVVEVPESKPFPGFKVISPKRSIKSKLDSSLSAEARRHIFHQQIYVPQFLERVHEIYLGDWNPDWDDEVADRILKMSKEELESILKELNLMRTMYDSTDFYLADDDPEEDAERVYNLIMDIEDPSLEKEDEYDIISE